MTPAIRRTLMLWDGLLCFKFPRLARYRVVVVDRLNGEEHDMSTVRFRDARNAAAWALDATDTWAARGDPDVQFSIRGIPQ